MPEVPQEIPEKKTCVVPHKKPEGPHDEGICCWKLRDLGKCLFLYKCVSCVYWLLLTPKCKNINIFKVPEAPKEVVPEKKITVAPPKKPEVPPAKGSHPHVTVIDTVCLSLLCLIMKILISLKHPRCQRQLSQKGRCLKLYLPNQKVLLLKVIMKLSELVFLKRKTLFFLL